MNAVAVYYAGLRLRLPRRRTRVGDIDLPFGDVAEALTHPCLAYRWAERGADLRIEAPGQAKRRALPGVLDHAAGEPIVITSASKHSRDFVRLPARLGRDYSPGSGRGDRPVVIVLDNGPIHTGKVTAEALAERSWLAVERLSRYASELNDIERSWRDLKRHCLARRTFRDADDLDAAIHDGVRTLNRERHAQASVSISKAA